MTPDEDAADAFLRGVRVFLEEDRATDIEFIHCWAQVPDSAFILYRYRRGPSSVFGWRERLPASNGAEAAVLSGMDAAQELSEPLGNASSTEDDNGVEWVGQAVHMSHPKLPVEAMTSLRSAIERWR